MSNPPLRTAAIHITEQGHALYDQRRYAEALAAYNHAVQVDPLYAIAHNGAGIALAGLERHAEAIPAYHRALQLDS